MKLTSKQLKALPDDEFGIIDNGKRSFPLSDEKHVRLAIQMFKYCPKGKEKELAANINKKAKQYGLKMNIKGAFAKYADPSILGLAGEASNVGTLEPIVGGPESINFPKIDDDSDFGQKIMSGLIQKKAVAEFSILKDPKGTSIPVWELRCKDKEFEKFITTFDDNIGNRSGNSQFADFDRYVKRLAYNTEIKHAIQYMTNPHSKYNEYIAEKNVYSSEAAKNIYGIMIDNINHTDKIDMIFNILRSIDPEDFIYLMTIVYQNDNDDYRVFRALIRKMTSSTNFKYTPIRIQQGQLYEPDAIEYDKDYKTTFNFPEKERQLIDDVVKDIGKSTNIGKLCDYLVSISKEKISDNGVNIFIGKSKPINSFVGSSLVELSDEYSDIGYHVASFDQFWNILFVRAYSKYYIVTIGSNNFYDMKYRVIGIAPYRGNTPGDSDLYTIHELLDFLYDVKRDLDSGSVPSQDILAKPLLIDISPYSLDRLSKITMESNGQEFTDDEIDAFMNDMLDDCDEYEVVESMVYLFNKSLVIADESLKAKSILPSKFNKYKYAFNECMRRVKNSDTGFNFMSAYEEMDGFSLVSENVAKESISYTYANLINV